MKYFGSALLLISGLASTQAQRQLQDANGNVHYVFPATETGEFTHGLCVMGASTVQATCTDGSVKYSVYPVPFGDGINIWGDRTYITSDVDGPSMCEGGTYLEPTRHKTIRKGSQIEVIATPENGETLTICAFVEADGKRHGDWDDKLPDLGFTPSDKPFKWANNQYDGTMTSFCQEFTASSVAAALGDHSEGTKSYTFPATATHEFTHGLCVMGASAVMATSDDPDVSYSVYPAPFGNGVDIWGDRTYTTSGVSGTDMCEGGTYLEPTAHKTIDTGTLIKVSATANPGETVMLCAFIETEKRDGDWDVKLPRLGFKPAEKPFFWSNEKYNGWMKSYCGNMDMIRELPAQKKPTFKKGKICAKGTGDPHMTTFDGHKYDCQGEGDYTLAKALDGDFEFQGRWEKVPGLSVTTHQGVAIKSGYANEPKVEVSYDKQCNLDYYIDDTNVDLEFTYDTGNPKVEFVASGKSRYFIFESGVSMEIKFHSWRGDCLLNVYLCLPEALVTTKQIAGIFGTPDGDKNNDFMTRSGDVPARTSYYNKRKAHDFCVENWCVPNGGSLFNTPNPNDACKVPFDDAFERAVQEAPERIKDACNDESACIIDAVAVLQTCKGDQACLDAIEENGEDIKAGQDTLVAEDEREFDPEPPKPEEREEPVDPTDPPPKPSEPFFAPPAEKKAVDDKEKTPTPPDAPTEEDKSSDQAFSKGDPHFKTFGGELYDYHGECDLVLLHNPDFNQGMGMDIHIRTKIQSFWSSIESSAIKIGDDIMEIKADEGSDEWLWLNGQEMTSFVKDGEWNRLNLGGFLVRYKSNGPNTREANIYLKGSKEVLEMKTFKSFVRIDVNWKGSKHYDNSVGLLGSHANQGKRVGRDGKFIENFNAFGQEWQVIPEVDGLLFHDYEGAVVGKKCVMPPAYHEGAEVPTIASLRRRRLGASSLTEDAARKACDHLVDPEEIKACVFDVLATQDLNMASTW